MLYNISRKKRRILIMKRTMRKTISIFLAVLILLGTCAVASFAYDVNLKYEVDEFGNAVLVSCSSTTRGTVTVDSQALIKGKWYPVKSIGEKAFEDCNKVTHIVIPEGVTTIGYKAFAKCDKLETIDIPESLVNCDYDAFYDCGKITVNCYTSNYQFFSVIGFDDNVIINIIDAIHDDGPVDAPETPDEQETPKLSFFERVRQFFIRLLSLFGIKLGN